MARVDLTVRGGGIFGLSVAWAAARRGAHVRLVESASIGAGSSGGLVGALAPHAPEQWNDKKQFQLESLLMAQDWWAGAAAAGGADPGYARTGRLQPLPDDRAVEVARARTRTAAALWRGQADWRVVPATGAPLEPLSPTGLLVHDTLTARLHPRLAAACLVAAIRAAGSQVVMGEAPDEGATLWATGLAGLQDLSLRLGRKVGGGVKGQALSLRHCLPEAPQVFADGLHVVPHADGTVAIGSTSENDWTDPAATDAQLDDLHRRAVAACPVLHGAPVVERWAGVRPRARARAPLRGERPRPPGHFIANGGFKIGFGMAPKVAEVMADLILNGQDAIPPGFRVEASL
ncbi:MAG: FAD-dependent oxidoreductase [Paracoccaceae bacterium]